eukprot:357241-Chlamydomonas_euryale.AAC.9
MTSSKQYFLSQGVDRTCVGQFPCACMTVRASTCGSEDWWADVDMDKNNKQEVCHGQALVVVGTACRASLSST